MQYGIPASLLASLLLTGCSLMPDWSAQNTTASQAQAVSDLKVPDGLSPAKKPSQYDIPPAPNAPVSEAELKSPMQVLALATNSRVEEEEKEARVWFERSEFTGELLPYLQQSIRTFGAEKNIEITQKDDQGLVFETGWVTRTEEEGWWWWKQMVDKEQSRFLLILDPKSHGRSIGVRSQLLEHRYLNDESRQLTPIAQKREEVYFLNRYIDQVATIELEQIKRKKAQLVKVNLTTGFDAEGNAVMLTSQNLDQTWLQLEVLFEQNGFTVTDLNRTSYTYYLSYKQPETGFWDSLWGAEEATQLPLSEGDYQLVLKKHELGTSLSWRDSEGKVLSAELVNSLHQALLPMIQKAGLEL
ncbi:outer membrane protein assembly factor BamC [Rheinheimera sp.]|uniref:outer membrane protein assembly factor BamC n=1 Tax=Rheinheimera sp. TaxID=1869214 RepID=UPI00307E852A